MLSSRSKSPEASASRLDGGMRGCSRGTSEREISFCSGRYSKSEHVMGNGIEEAMLNALEDLRSDWESVFARRVVRI